MFEIRYGDGGEILMSGRLDAAQVEAVQAFLAEVTGWRTVDLRGLDYISSAGLATLLWTQKRLLQGGGGLKLVNVNRHINTIFEYTGFHRVFEIQAAAD